MKNYTRLFIIGLLSMSFGFQSCLDDDDNKTSALPNALVTVKTNADDKTYFQLDENTTLFPENITSKLYDGKRVRALVNYSELEKSTAGFDKTVHLNWIDSIRTKDMVPYTDDIESDSYGNDPVEIVYDWVTVAEDGYLTLRVRTVWSEFNRPHYLNLIGNINEDDPFEVELRHDAKGDVHGHLGDALIAFRLNCLPAEIPEGQKLTMKFRSLDGTIKEVKFSLNTKSSSAGNNVDTQALTRGAFIK